MPLLAVVAAASERLRVGTFALNACLRHPAVLAQDLATLDVLSGGRLEIGLGAGWNKPEHDAIGIAFEPVGVRIKRLTEAITILKGCFAEGRSPSRASTTPSPATTARPSRRNARTRRSSWAAQHLPHRRAGGRHRRSARRGAPPRRPHP
jgi:alkanesulfonate monooxygenase SsuD/methylene tetrahydromethanopterin reductase-like flavin-dependent oxidoreductase (luciferase family)